MHSREFTDRPESHVGGKHYRVVVIVFLFQ